MSTLQAELANMVERLNTQIYAHHDATGVSLKNKGWEMDAAVAEDGQTLVVVVELLDGFIATASIDHFVDLVHASKVTVH